MKFNSQICTSREQSQRLLALGLKKETADMGLVPLMEWDDCTAQEYFTGIYMARTKEDVERYNLDYIPAWSLHRLLSMLPDDAPKIYWILDGASITIAFEDDDSDFFPHKGDIYEGVVNCIEWLIKEGYFNNEYLV